MAKTIAVSSLNLDEAAERWLTAHGAHFSYSGALVIIELPKDAHVDSGPHNQEYAISFVLPDGSDYEETYAEIDLEVDCYETRLRLVKPKLQPPEDSTEYLQDLNGHNQEVAWEIAEDQARRATDDREFDGDDGPPAGSSGCWNIEDPAERGHNIFSYSFPR